MKPALRKDFPIVNKIRRTNQKNTLVLPELAREVPSTNEIARGLKLLKLIGEGAFAVVYLASIEEKIVSQIPSAPRFLRLLHTTNEKQVAVKVIDKSCKRAVQTAEAELLILTRADNPFVVKMHFACQTPKILYIGLDYCEGGDLYTKLSCGITLRDAIFYIAEIGMALYYLHKKNILYRDLKPENIVLTHDGHIRLIDFGFAVILDETHLNPATGRHEIVSECGTVDYSPPEIFRRRPHSYESDWWSFGVLSFELLSGELPFRALSGGVQAQCNYICEPTTTFMCNSAIQPESDEFDFIRMFLVKNQKLRFGYMLEDFPKLVEHALMTDIIWSEI